jgi:branched-chain amino acid transport system permease protein
MYGLLALGFYVTYAVSRTVNFSQGSSMMLGAVLCYAFGVTLGWGVPAGALAALGFCAVWGAVVERLAVRPFVRGGSNAWLMSTVAIGIVLENAVLFTYGKEPRGLPSPLVRETIDVAGLGVYPLQLVIPAVALLIAGALHAWRAAPDMARRCWPSCRTPTRPASSASTPAAPSRGASSSPRSSPPWPGS